MGHVIDLAGYRAQKQSQQEQEQAQDTGYWLLYRMDLLSNGQKTWSITAVPWLNASHREHILTLYGTHGWEPLLNEAQDTLVPRYPWSWSNPLGSLLAIITDMQKHSSPVYQKTGLALTRYWLDGSLHIVRILHSTDR